MNVQKLKRDTPGTRDIGPTCITAEFVFKLLNPVSDKAVIQVAAAHGKFATNTSKRSVNTEPAHTNAYHTHPYDNQLKAYYAHNRSTSRIFRGSRQHPD
jgi:hypothetical protein